ncbi:MAG: InlB B-repeat-containing protein [Clostridia bacterium]|nr:InlB B-repeat-containing protein [Clostridia bacterium]
MTKSKTTSAVVRVLVIVLLAVLVAVSLVFAILYGNGSASEKNADDISDKLILGSSLTVEDIKASLGYNHAGLDANDEIKIYSVDKNGERIENEEIIALSPDTKELRVVGVGKFVIKLTDTSLDSTASIEAELESRFSSKDTPVIIAECYEQMLSDGIISKSELQTVEELVISNRVLVDASDFCNLPSLKRVELDNINAVCALDKLTLNEGTRIFVPSAIYSSYVASDAWTQHEQCVFVKPSEQNKLSIVVHKNGGTLGNGSQRDFESLSLENGTAFDADSFSSLFKKGYTLKRFYTYQIIDGRRVKIEVNKSYKFTTDTKIYADWSANEYTVYLHLDEGSDPIETKFKYDEEKPLVEKVPELDKYLILGWTSEQGSERVSFTNTQVVKNLKENQNDRLDLYAVLVTKNFEIHYFNWGQTPEQYHPLRIHKTSHEYGDEVTVGTPTLPTDPSNVANFIGWSLTPNAPIPELDQGDKTKDLRGTPANDGIIRLYAVYNYATYTVSYFESEDDAINNGEPIGVSMNVQKGTDLKLFDSGKRNGHKFLGWKDVESGVFYHYDKDICDKMANVADSEYIYAPESVVEDGIQTSRPTVSLCAVWERNYFKVSFAQGEETSIFKDATLYAGVECDLEGSFYRTGYKHGFLATSDGAYKLNAGDDGFVSVTDVNALYEYVRNRAGKTDQSFDSENASITFESSGWDPIKYKIVYITDDPGSFPDQEVEYNKSVTLHGPENKEHYDFNGWYSEKLGKLFDASQNVENLTEKYFEDENEDGVIVLKPDRSLKSYYVEVKKEGEKGGSCGYTSGWYTYGTKLELEISYSGNINKSWKLDGKEMSGTSYELIVTGKHTITIKSDQDSCVAKGTPILMADGTTKKVEDIVLGDIVLTLDHMTGKLVPSAVAFTYYGYGEVDILKLKFANGGELEVLNTGHGLYDMTLDKYVLVSPDNIDELVGHSFACISDDGSVQGTALVGYELSRDTVERYDLATANNLNHIAGGMLACSDVIVNVCNTFDFDSLVYDQEQLKKDIEQYGLYTYEEWSEYVTREQFEAFSGAYFKIAVGKGLITEQDILSLIADINRS